MDCPDLAAAAGCAVVMNNAYLKFFLSDLSFCSLEYTKFYTKILQDIRSQSYLHLEIFFLIFLKHLNCVFNFLKNVNHISSSSSICGFRSSTRFIHGAISLP
jgi:hypothetical protein